MNNEYLKMNDRLILAVLLCGISLITGSLESLSEGKPKVSKNVYNSFPLPGLIRPPGFRETPGVHLPPYGGRLGMGNN